MSHTIPGEEMMAWDDTYGIDELTGARLLVAEDRERSARLVAEGETLPQAGRRPLNHGGNLTPPNLPRVPRNEYGQTPAQERDHARAVASVAGLLAACASSCGAGILWARLGYDPGVGLAVISLVFWGVWLAFLRRR